MLSDDQRLNAIKPYRSAMSSVTCLRSSTCVAVRATLKSKPEGVLRHPSLICFRNRRVRSAGEKLPQTPFSLDYLVQGCGTKLRIVQGQQGLESRYRIFGEHPFVGHMGQFQRRLDGKLGCLEAPDRFASVTVLLQKPRKVHGPHQFIEQMAVAMTIPAGSKGEMTE